MDVVEVAHRCYAGIYPENTVGAAEMATSGEHHPVPDMVEIDVQPCQGDAVVVFHDEDLRKRGERGLTDRSGVPWRTPCDTVLDAEVLESGERVPTLESVLSVIPPEVGVNIELKDVGTEEVQFRWGDSVSGDLGRALPPDERDERRRLWHDFVERVLRIASGAENDILLSSFFEGAIAAARSVDGSVPAAFLLYSGIRDGLEVVERYGLEAVHPPLDMVEGPFFNSRTHTDRTFADVDLVSEAEERGIAVNAWTVNTWYEADRMVDAGVDGIITNYPGLLRFTEDGPARHPDRGSSR